MRMTRTTAAATGVRPLAVVILLLTGLLGANNPALAQGGSSDVAIFTSENGQPAYDACYVLVGYSEVGCDENGDGRIMFAQVPWGTYTVHQTADLGAGRVVNDFTIDVRGNINSSGFEGFSATIANSNGSSSASGTNRTSDIAIVTTEDGHSVTDACYVLVDYSDVGCDENGDGMITFQDVPLGAYTVTQTADLGRGRQVADFSITVSGAASSDGWERFSVKVASSAGGPSGVTGAKDISLITRAPGTGDLLTGACYVLVGHSNEGCDENGDGQVTFAAIAPGTYTVRQTTTPPGFSTIKDFPLTVDDTFPQVPVGYLVKQAPNQNASNTRNVSFVFVDSRSLTKIVPAQICITMENASNVGCDEDLVDGQVDFLEVETGTYPLTFSNLPSGWQIMGDDRIGPSATIERGESPEIIYIGVYTGDATGSGDSSAAGTGTSTSSRTSGPASSTQETLQLTIGATSCHEPNVSGGCKNAIGARFIVKTESGDYLGECVIEGHGDEPYLVACAVQVSDGITVVVTEDTTTIDEGLSPEVNPIVWDTSRRPVPPNVPSFWGPIFKNVPSSSKASGSGNRNLVVVPFDTRNTMDVERMCA